MKNWKKILLGTLAATAVSAGLSVIAACKVDTGIKNSFVVDENQTLTATGEAGASVEFPEVSKEGYIFKGWYTNADFIGMPVTSATYESETTYYARWAKGYEVVLDLDGGTLDTQSKLYVEEGAPISTAVQNLVPTYGDYQFGGWYLGDEPLAANEKMTTAGVTLTARYKAEYTVDVYLQSVTETDTYVKSESYATGYALIGEDFEPEVTVSGFTVTSNENELTEMEISGNKSQNVFRVYFDRNSYTLTLSANYPDGSFGSVSSSHIYEQEFTLPENTFGAKGSRFIGWAKSPDAGYEDIIKDTKYSLKNDEVLYAIWNIGYVDMFSGEDVIFVDPTDSNKITLNRGGVDLDGTYDEIREVYTLRSTTDPSFKITVKLRDDGKFVYLSSRQGSYVLYTAQGTINRNVRMIFDDYDGCEYNSVNTFTKSGSYTVDGSGYYVANVVDQVSGEESTVHFILGLAYDNSGVLTRVFKIRGEEYGYGGVPGYIGGRFVYPVLTFDGYGNVGVELPNNQGANYSYTIDTNGVINVYHTQNMQTVTDLVAKFDNINGQYVYKYYDSALDREYRNANNSDIIIKLDGCNAVKYTDGNNSYTGTYAEVVALNNGCRILAVTEENGTVHTYLLNGMVFTEEANVSGVYYFYDDGGRLRTPLLIVKTSDDPSTAEAAILDIDGSNFWGVVSRGTIVRNENSFTYSVTGDIASWSNDKYSEMTLVIGGVSSSGGSYPVYFLLSATERGEDGTENVRQLSTLYVGEDGSKLTLTEAFAIYEPAGSNAPLLGSYTNGVGYIAVTAGGNKYYFVLSRATEEGADNTFEQLVSEPMSMYQLMGNMPNTHVTLTLTGRITDGVEEAIYDAGANKYVGVVESEIVNVLDGEVRVYKFTGRDEDKNSDLTFYFTVSVNSLIGYCFSYYYSTSDMVLGSFLGVDGDGNPNNDAIRITADNKFTYVYGESKKRVVGTWTSEEVTVFGIIHVTVYTFTPDDENSEISPFKFTLRTVSSATYFLIEGEDAYLTAADGSTVEFDGATHVAQYTDKDGVQYENYYWTAANVLDEGKAAYMMIIDGQARYFDADGDTFTLRGTEQAPYFVIKNNSLTLEQYVFELNGYGGVKAVLNVSTDDEQTFTGTYKADGRIYTVTLDNGKTFTGYLGEYTMTADGESVTVPAFYVEFEGYSGSYLNEADLSVLVLDSIGNAVKYSSYGVRETGGYVILDDGLIYYMNSTSTDAAVYTIEGNTVKAESNSSTYYANDLSAAVFTSAGNLVFGSGDAVLYVFNEDKSGFKTYIRSGENVNEYGFAAQEYSITDGKFTYGDKEYEFFDGMPITLTAADGSTLMFTPSGSMTFSVAATYTPADGEEENCFLITWYNTDGEFIVTLSRDEKKLSINGSTQEYGFRYEYKINVDLTNSSFAMSDTDVDIGLIAYDYDYITGNGMNDSAMIISATETDGEYTFTVDGYFTNSAGQMLRFHNGILSKAGGVPTQGNGYSNTFVCEFVGSDNYTYHLYFMLLPFNGSYVFVTCPLVRVAGSQKIDEEGTVLYEKEAFVYGSSLLDFEDYVANSYYYPALKYKGELICASGWLSDEEKDQRRFISYEYKDGNQLRYLYVVDGVSGENATVAKYELKSYSTADKNYTVYVWQNGEEIFEIYAVGQSSMYYVRECVKNEDGSYDVATANGLYYRVTIVIEGENVTVTVERREAPTQPDEGEEVETPDENIAA